MQTRLTVLYHSAQKGAALVVSMVMLLVITVIGVAVMGGSRLEWLMANNSHLQTDAYRNAEIALAAGLSTTSISNPPMVFPPAPVGSPMNPQLLADVTMWSNGSFTSISVPTPTGSAAYVVEYIGCSEYLYTPPTPPAPPPPVTYANDTCTDSTASHVFAYTYRVWALGTDGMGAARILQTTHTLINNQVPVASLPGWIPGPPARLPSLDNRAALPSS